MHVIYTISHPFTNEIVYVGYSINFSNRAYQHINNTRHQAISKWINDLMDEYMLPKIEIIDEFETKSEALYFEAYYICQIAAWGFTLLNKNKLPATSAQIRLTKKRKTGNIICEKSYYKQKPNARKWTLNSFELGRKYEMENDRRVIYSFRTMFIEYAKRFSLKRHLSRIDNGNQIILIVEEGIRIYKETYGLTKSGKKRWYKPQAIKIKLDKPVREPKIIRYNLSNAKIGDVFIISNNKSVSFRNVFYQFLKAHGNVFYFIKTIHDEHSERFDIVPYGDRKQKSTSQDKIDIILSDIRSAQELSNILNCSVAVIYKIRKQFKQTA